jgi:hypothetical protein
MKKQLYYSKKGNLTVIVGKKGDKRILIWTLPSPEKLIDGLLQKVSFFPNGKDLKIIEKLKYLDNITMNPPKGSQDVPLINIKRTQ